LFVVVDNYWAILMKNLTRSLERVTFCFSALSMMSAIELLNLSPALASSATYQGRDADVTVTCVPAGGQVIGNFSINAQKPGAKFFQVGGIAYFNKNFLTAQPILVITSPRSIISGSQYVREGSATNFGALIEAVGVDGWNGVISLPDLSENPDKAFGYSVNCPFSKADGGDGSGGSGGGGNTGSPGSDNLPGNGNTNAPGYGGGNTGTPGSFVAGPGILCNSTGGLTCWYIQ
jgi:hypothetical protein